MIEVVPIDTAVRPPVTLWQQYKQSGGSSHASFGLTVPQGTNMSSGHLISIGKAPQLSPPAYGEPCLIQLNILKNRVEIFLGSACHHAFYLGTCPTSPP